ncbi:hypothetical protein SAMN05421547_1275 [Delftia lacustris]|uniref:Uncharacterized protein n=1 Tax=Delftia lacustris TaxID=558537 RepID=A0A1H3TCF2_9BURK|nr:hypothetical protein SAMN05421547_1275 [Delftia lacustris]
MESQQTRKLKYISLNVLLHGIEFLLGIESLLEASCKNLRNGGTPNKENKIPWLGSTSSWGIFFCLGKKHFCEGAQRAKRLKLLKSREATGNEKKTGTSLFRYKTALRQHFCAFPAAPSQSATSATPQRCCRAWPGGWRRGRCGGVRGGVAPPGARVAGGAGQHRVAPAGAQVAPRRARQGSGITPLMGRPSHVAMAQPSPPRAQRLERTSSGSLAQAISEGSPPTGQRPHQPESRSATGDT